MQVDRDIVYLSHLLTTPFLLKITVGKPNLIKRMDSKGCDACWIIQHNVSKLTFSLKNEDIFPSEI